MERFSYKVFLFKRSLRLYEGYLEVKVWYDELSALKSFRTTQDLI